MTRTKKHDEAVRRDRSAVPSAPAASAAAPEVGRRRGPGRPRAGSEDKRERILNEATTLFGSRGYAATSLADIAGASDISKAGLLHHFSSKDELFTQVLERRDRTDRAGLKEDGCAEDPWELLEAMVEIVERNTSRRELVALYAATAVSVLDAQHPAHEWFVSHLTRSVDMVEKALERGKEVGTVRPEAPSRMIARTVAALSDGLQIQWLCSTTPSSAAGECLETTMVSEFRLFVESLREQWSLEPEPAVA